RPEPLDVAQVHVVTEADADDRPRAVDHEHELGLRIVPNRRGMNPNPRADAHRRHRWALREELRVRADADFEVLGPHALLDEHVLHACRLRRAGADAAEVGADDRLDLFARAVSERGIAARPLLDDALEEARDERHPARLDRLEIAWREHPRLRAIAMPFDAVRNEGLDARESRRALDRGAHVFGRRDVQQMTDGRIRAAGID